MQSSLWLIFTAPEGKGGTKWLQTPAWDPRTLSPLAPRSPLAPAGPRQPCKSSRARGHPQASYTLHCNQSVL